MKDLSREEFQERTEEVARARKIFIPHFTKNISIAFELYQEVLAEEKKEVFLRSKTAGARMPTVLDLFERPACPDCGTELRLKVLLPQGPQNLYGFKTLWFCHGQREAGEYCGYEEAPTMKSVEDWMHELRVKKEE